jgi:hypothetical protein
MLFDLAADLLVPPLTQLAAVSALGAAAALAAAWLGYGAVPAAVLWSAALLGLAVYVVRGCALSGMGARVLGDLLWAPVYVVWKCARLLRPGRRAPREWVRTSRTAES